MDRPFLSRPAGSVDLFRRITEGAKDPVVEPGPSGFLEEMRADIFPHDVALARHLEDAAVTAFADQRVAVGEPLRTRDVRAEELEERLVGILPDDRVGARINLDHAREGRGMVDAVGAVVEDQDVAVGQRARVVLSGPAAGGRAAR